MFRGIDGYPVKDKYADYFIGGGRNWKFKATAIELYGVKT